MDVASWLRSLGLEKYEANFRDNPISEKVVPRLTAEDLRELGVSTVGDRRVLLDAIAGEGGLVSLAVFLLFTSARPHRSR